MAKGLGYKVAREICRTRKGWKFHSMNKGHIKLVHENGNFVYMSSTPSKKSHFEKNVLGDVRRAERNNE